MNSINATMARQAFALLSSLILLLIALHWVAANYPTSSPYPSTDIYHVQPGKTALFIEAYRERHRFNFVRIFGMDFDKGTMRELYCPASEGLMWDEICGVDTRGNAICRTRNHHKNNYYRVTPSSGDVQLIAMNRSSLILVGNRFLVDSEAGENTTFVYRDLEEPGFPVHSRSVHLDNFTDLTSVPESTSFYCRVHPSRAEPEESDLSNNAELDSQSKATLVLTPSPTSLDDENETLVLIKMSIDGPLVVARWPVIGGSGYFTVQAGNNCIACQSLDRKFLDIHDSSSGLTRCQIPIPASSLDKNNRIDNWSVNEWLVDFRGAAGGKLTFDCQSGSSIDISSAWGGWTYGGNANEFLTMARETLPSSIPDHLQVRDRADGKVLFEWPIPDPDYVHGAGPFLQLDNLILLATDDGRVLFVEKTNGRIERTFAPRFWVPYLTCVVAFLGLVWLLCWFCFSIEHGFVVWMDAALIASVAFLFLWWRITLAGCYQQYDRMAWTSVAAMLMAIGNLLNHETLYSQRGLVRSTLPLFVFASALLTTIQFNIVRGWYVNAFTMRTVTIGSVLLLGSIVTIRLCPAWNENGNSTNHSKPSISGWRISLRQLMFITFVVATMMATVRWLRLDWSLELLNREGMSLVVMSCVSLALYCAAVRVRYLVFKIVLVSVLLIALTFQATLQLPTAWHFSDTLPNPVRWIEFVGASAVSTILITLRFAFIRRASI